MFEVSILLKLIVAKAIYNAFNTVKVPIILKSSEQYNCHNWVNVPQVFVNEICGYRFKFELSEILHILAKSEDYFKQIILGYAFGTLYLYPKFQKLGVKWLKIRETHIHGQNY